MRKMKCKSMGCVNDSETESGHCMECSDELELSMRYAPIEDELRAIEQMGRDHDEANEAHIRRV